MDVVLAIKIDSGKDSKIARILSNNRLNINSDLDISRLNEIGFKKVKTPQIWKKLI